MTGKVWLVGAGPGGEELLTIKAKRVIEQAEVVVYDALIGCSVMDLVPESAERIYVGKRAGHHSMAQEKINELLLSSAEQGKRVVRLKGGDPFLFGRGGEELELLEEHQIPFEVVPGVTSALAVPAYFGIPVTHRDLASSVHIVTGHQKKDEPLDISFDALKEVGGTIVFLMGISSLHNIIFSLLKAGMEPRTPAAILQQGAGGGQKKISGTLEDIERKAREEGASTPAIIVVGEVVRLGEKFSWHEKLPLSGKRFIVTRPRERQRELAQGLRELGAEVTELPTVEVRGIHPNPKLREEIFRLSDYRFLVFTSPSGVEEFMRELFDMGKDVRHIGGISIAVIGSGTAKVLRRYGLTADRMPEIYSGRALGALLSKECREGDRVLIARSDIGNPELVTELQREKDIEVTDVAAYCLHNADQMSRGENRCPDAEPESADGVFFTSASTVRGFFSLYPLLDFSRIRAFCIGEMTARAAEKCGMQVKTARMATVENLIRSALE